jgi:MoxR-like ATPase
VATTTAPRAKRGPKTAVKVAPEDVLAVASDISTNVLVDRTAEMRVLVLGLLAGGNVHQLGPPGSAKSLGLRELAKRVDDANYFEKQVSAQMPMDAVMGGYDMPRFAQTGEFARNVQGKAPWAHIVNIDEIFRANGPTIDALLSLYNSQERLYEGNGDGQPIRANTLFFVSSSNHLPDAGDPQFSAFVDRISAMQWIDYVKSDESFKEILRRSDARTTAERDGTYKRVTITLEQLVIAQNEVAHVRLTPDFLDGYARVRVQARDEGLMISDRRWVELIAFSKASAWLAGRDFLVPNDIAAVEHGLWREHKEIPLAHKLVLDFHSTFEKEATQRRQEAAEWIAGWEQIRPVVEGTPPNERLEQETITHIANISRALADLQKEVRNGLERAKAEKADAAGLRELDDEMSAIRKWWGDNGLPMPRDWHE